MITEVEAKKVLTFHPNAFPTNWDLNPYRGCTIGCKYCFAQYSHNYLGLDNFFRDILVKINVAERLDAEMSRKSWQHDQIKIGGTTDLYQHAEKRYELLPKIYDIVKKHRNPVFIQTKSNLILRDFELIKDLSKVTTVDITTSITSFDESVRKIIEPGGSSAMERMEMLAKFRGIARKTVVGFMPIIPLISDNDENLDTAFRLTKEFGLENIVTNVLFLRGAGKPQFLKVTETHFPEIAVDFAQLYRYSTVNSEYETMLYAKIGSLRQKYQLYGRYEPVAKQSEAIQLSLF
ncbi:MAG: SPL family radical SAM protein [Bacteroidales bacterium]